MKIGVDIGGTKCAVVLGDEERIVNKIRFATTSCEETIENIIKAIEDIGAGDAIGISCGGPLDSDKGVIMSPPNLSDWDNVHITKILSDRFGIPAYLCNDANACALAEWKYGAGKGTRNMVFLTFGTGLGAGLIIDGKLYSGTNGNAGEVGHVRLE
jgi:glucokinase